MKSGSDCGFSLKQHSVSISMPSYSSYSGWKKDSRQRDIDSIRFSQKPDVNSSIFVQVVGPKGPPGPMVNKRSLFKASNQTNHRIDH